MSATLVHIPAVGPRVYGRRGPIRLLVSSCVVFVAGFSGLLSLGGCDSEAGSKPLSTPADAVRDAKVSLGEAIGNAQQEIGDGVAIEAEFERTRARDVYEIEFVVADVVHEVIVDSATGRVLEREVDDEPGERAEASAAAELLGRGRTSLASAVTLAEADTRGRAFEAHVDGEAIVVRLVGDAGGIEVHVAIADGSILRRGEADVTPEADDEDEGEGEESDDDAS